MQWGEQRFQRARNLPRKSQDRETGAGSVRPSTVKEKQYRRGVIGGVTKRAHILATHARFAVVWEPTDLSRKPRQVFSEANISEGKNRSVSEMNSAEISDPG